MTKENLIKIIGNNFKPKDVGIGVLNCISEKEQVENLANELLKAINYTRCCKSDSELLPSKEKLNFEDWLKLRKIERINDDAFKWEGSKYTYYYVNDIYKQYLKN